MEKGCESFIYATLTLDVQQESRIFTPKKKKNRSPVALRARNAESGRELFKSLKDVASLQACTRK